MLWRIPRLASPLPAGFIEPCQPRLSQRPPTGPDWIHEIKHDGYRLIARRNGTRVRLFTRRGHDWTERYPAIEAAIGGLRVTSATLDGEAAICGEDGVTRFDRLHSRSYDGQALLYAFDLLELDGEDLRGWPLERRKARLRKLLARARPGIAYVDHMEEEDGEAVFRHACRLGLEGIVCKRRDRPYRSGRAKSWIKVKNPQAPAALRIEENGSW
jgi:ATP-dependent DNA ligase